MKFLLLLFIIFIGSINVKSQTLIPSPEQVKVLEGYCELNDTLVSVYIQDDNLVSIPLLCNVILDETPIRVTQHKSDADISLLVSQRIPAEGYKIHIDSAHIKIEASDKGGYVYAFQTLRQLKINNKNKWNNVFISDHPYMKWRGFMLDSGRQYQSVATIKKYIDMASMLKMNIFHWHLTEGLGWRIEIKKYPRLTQIGAYVGEGIEQQGFYSREDILELVHYAEERNITIVPEIDMPGHAEAALASYPELGCFGVPVEIPKSGFTKNIFCAGKEQTIRVLKDVLNEVCQIFPSPYIHLGGDEAPKDNWGKCADCKKRIEQYGLKDTHELQLWFSTEMANHLKDKGRRAIFWGDLVYKTGYPLPDNVVIQWWDYRNKKDLSLRNALRLGYPVICSSNYYNYLNFPVTPWRGYKENRTFNIQDAYIENPSFHAYQENNSLIWGMTCALWTDDGVTEAMIDQRLFPRILALAEQMWHCGKLAPFDEFYQRVYDMKIWFEGEGFIYGRAFKDE